MKGKRFRVMVGVLLCLSKSTLWSLAESDLMWSWKCDSTDSACKRVSTNAGGGDDILYPSLETCRLVCGNFGGLWPQPSIGTVLGNNLFTFSASSINFVFSPPDGEVASFLQDVVNIFLKSVTINDSAKCANSNNIVSVSITVALNVTDLSLTTDEGYNLEVVTTKMQNSVKISAKTVFGARHALETLSQLIDFYETTDGQNCLAIVDQARISDAPFFAHRGLLLDTARNFLSVASIKKHLDGMGYSKLNVLHWHITDSQSFPLELPSLPNMTKYGAYSEAKIYHPEDVEAVITYAKLRGVRVIIEIDAPSHSGNGWQWGPDAGLGNLAVCVNQQPWRNYCIQPPCGQLNPVNENLYSVLKDLYKDITDMLSSREFFHMGGDEVYIACWNSTQEILDYLGDKPRTEETFLDLWSNYQAKALTALDSAQGNNNTVVIVWTSHLTTVDVIEKYLSKDRYVIQTWVPASDTLPQDLLSLGYRIIVSTKDAWYLDHGFWGGTVYHNWRKVYSNQLPTDSSTLGGEVCMWGEYVDDSSVEAKVWPRAAAAGERMWANPKTSADEAERRFYRHRERLVTRGINAEAVIPKWCYQNEADCSTYHQ